MLRDAVRNRSFQRARKLLLAQRDDLAYLRDACAEMLGRAVKAVVDRARQLFLPERLYLLSSSRACSRARPTELRRRGLVSARLRSLVHLKRALPDGENNQQEERERGGHCEHRKQGQRIVLQPQKSGICEDSAAPSPEAHQK